MSKLTKKVVFYKKDARNGIVYVKDFGDEQNNLLSTSVGSLHQTFSI